MGGVSKVPARLFLTSLKRADAPPCTEACVCRTVQPDLFPLHIHDTYVVPITLDRLQKKQYIGPLPHPLPSPWVRIGWWHRLQDITSKCSNCISYNLFIFCPICMKFSHKFLHTYCFILCIKKKKSKIYETEKLIW